MKILMIASESLPIVKTGGLADVVFSLSKELRTQGHHVDIMIPEYQECLHRDKKGGSGLSLARSASPTPPL